jgi:hypothetical protein
MSKKKSKIERVIEGGNEVSLGDLRIGRKNLSLDISNYGGELGLRFQGIDKKYEYSAYVEEKGIRFFRCEYGNSSEKNQKESLQRVINENEIYKKGELVWRKEYPEQKKGYEFFYVSFSDSKD